MLLSFTQWVQATDLFTAVRGSWYSSPIVMSLHMVALALFGGTILITDLRLLGAWRKYPVSTVIEQLRWPKRIGFLLVATCGILMAGSKAEEYYYNAFFRIKMTVLALIVLHALVFRSGVYGNPKQLDGPVLPGRAKLAAALSLILWTSMACAGRAIGYIEPPLDKIHASAPWFGGNVGKQLVSVGQPHQPGTGGFGPVAGEKTVHGDLVADF
jgi:hypothetical protein